MQLARGIRIAGRAEVAAIHVDGAIPSARAPSSPAVGSLDQSERWIATGCARPLA